MAEKREIPVEALTFASGAEAHFGDNGENAKTIPIRMLARSAQPVDHWYWGRVVHDLEGMTRHKNRLAIDYAHNSDEVLGYLNKFAIDDEGLVVSGALTPFRADDRASEVVHKARVGVPYEASINFAGDGVKIEQIPENASAEVNGYQFEGPGVVIRQWPLRGVAVCPYGADRNTRSEFAETGETVLVEIQNTEISRMTNESTEAAEAVEVDENVESVESVEDAASETQSEEAVESDEGVVEADEDAQSDADDDESDADDGESDDSDEGEKPVEELTDARSECARFVELFGDAGGRWYAEGLTLDEARDRCNDLLRAENAELRQRLDALDLGEDEPLAFDGEHDEKTAEKSEKDKKVAELTNKIGANLAKVAAGVKFAKK